MEEKVRKKRMEDLKKEIQMHQNRLQQAQTMQQNEQKQLIAKLGIMEEYQRKGWENVKVSPKNDGKTTKG